MNDILKINYNVDMNNGFVNFGTLANPEYNALVLEQLKLIDKMRRENGIVDFILEAHDEDALEFKLYPSHCVKGSKEAELIPEFLEEQQKPRTYTFYKNSINGMLNTSVQEQIKALKDLREIIFSGVLADKCVMEFALTNARFLDQINKEVKLFVVKSMTDTYDSEDHNREEWLNIAFKVMASAGIEVVDNFEHLEKREQELGLYLHR